MSGFYIRLPPNVELVFLLLVKYLFVLVGHEQTENMRQNDLTQWYIGAQELQSIAHSYRC